MNESKIALIISIATFLGAVISPIIASFFNYRCRIKEKKMDIEEKRLQEINDFYLNRKLKTIEKFLHSASKAIENQNNSFLDESIGDIYMYADCDCWEIINEVIENINIRDYDKAIKPFTILSQKLHISEISKSTIDTLHK